MGLESRFRKILIVGIIFLFIGTSIYPCMNAHQNGNNEKMTSLTKDDEWYNVSSYPNYAPKGMPDFSQKQDEHWKENNGWLICAAVALADVFWWIDSKRSNQSGFPGDGIDEYKLVRDYHPPEPYNPGPYTDDHNFDNVNDNETQWDRNKSKGEFIDLLAWRIYGYFLKGGIIITKISNPIIRLTLHGLRIIWCMKSWIRSAGLQNNLNATFHFKPNFSMIDQKIRNGDGIVLGIFGAGSDPGLPPKPFQWGHCVALAGINSNVQIAISDPIRNVQNPSNDEFEHNDAYYVSHDIYIVNFTSPYPQLASFWLPNYGNGALCSVAIIISEKNN
ncbi:hypothetical protein AYK25_06525 [Thermoplasmatales archaeon SM1-50]|nr:MAG: hypothetical protein AYK25_06525 [Thermoplasmatales archaeon SM1-50]